MEVVVQTDYQDIYRITDGVLFIVNKFIPVDYSNDTPKKIYLHQSDMKYRLYNKFCQKRLKVLKEDYKSPSVTELRYGENQRPDCRHLPDTAGRNSGC